MDVTNIFVMKSSEGILLINVQNAEMLAVDKTDILEALYDIENNKSNPSCDAFYKPLKDEEIKIGVISSSDGIGILPTLKCNFSCKYCFEKNFEKIDMAPKMLLNIYPFVKRWNEVFGCMVSIDTVGLMGGEIFRKDSRPLVEKIFKTFGSVRYKVTTNGVDLLEYKELIAKYRPKIVVSLDGTEKMQMQQRMTGIENAYERILEGIDFLVKEGIDTSIATVYNPDYTIEDYQSFFDILESLGWLKKQNIKVSINLEMERGIQGCEKSRQMRTIEGFKKLLAEDERAWHVGRNIIVGIGGFEQSLKSKRKKGYVDNVRCPANLSDGLIFAPDGYVYNCNFIKEKENRVGQFYPEIKVYKDVVDKFLARSTNNIRECKNCSMALFCKAGCPASAITKHGTIDRGYCGIWKDNDILRELSLVINVDELYQMARKYKPKFGIKT